MKCWYVGCKCIDPEHKGGDTPEDWPRLSGHTGQFTLTVSTSCPRFLVFDRLEKIDLEIVCSCAKTNMKSNRQFSLFIQTEVCA